MVQWLSSVDHALFLFFNVFCANSLFDAFFPVVTLGNFWIIPGILAALVFIRYQKKKAILLIGLSLITIALSDPICCKIIKELVARNRPCNSHTFIHGAHFLIGFKDSHSFPSAHATNMFALATLFTFYYPKKWIWFFAFAAMIGFSRIYVGVHYPFDVLGGAILGSAIGACVALVQKWASRGVSRYAPTRDTESNTV